ncbi:MAG: hypothetical protein RLZZ225_509 [Pseudomonadota bacterium]
MLKFFSTPIYLYLLGYRDDISLGKCFHYGIHTEKDLKAARTYYLRAIKNQQYTAFYQLSILSHDQGRIGESFYYAGLQHEYAQDWRKALSSYEKAATENHALAMYRAGKLFAFDRVSKQRQVIIKKNTTTELAWYRKAAINYSAHALDALLELSATEAKASLHLAQMYEQGEIGNKKMISIALSYYEKAYEMQDQEAAYRLGQFYELGEAPIDKDLRRAFDYYAIAAKKVNESTIEEKVFKHYSITIKQVNKSTFSALTALERVVNALDNDLLRFELARIYQQDFNRNLAAFKCYQTLANKGNKAALEQMSQLAEKNADCAYELAKIYEKNCQAENNLQTAHCYFAKAMRRNHQGAKHYLESLANSDDASAQCTLAYVYYDQEDFAKAIFWCLKSVQQHYAPAINFLKTAAFTKKYYLFIAESYEKGKDDIVKNSDLALFFYEKSYAAGSQEAAFHLGQYYQRLDESASSDAFNKSKTYFIQAGQWGYSAADCAYELAKLYEKNTHIRDYLEIAYSYFAKAMLNAHALSREYLESLARLGNVKAQYALAYTYYCQQCFDKAIHWCLLAVEQHYAPAIDFLKTTVFTSEHYLLIAKSYEQGREGIAKNSDLALFFYEKSYAAGSKEVAFHLGQLYQLPSESGGEARDPKKAYECFIKAAQWGCLEAEIMLNQLGIKADPDRQLNLGHMYRDPPFNNRLKALYWYQQAIEASHLDPKLPLDDALTKMLEAIGVEFSLHEFLQLAEEKYRQSLCQNKGIFKTQAIDIDYKNIARTQETAGRHSYTARR